jgi:hypothetical protein
MATTPVVWKEDGPYLYASHKDVKNFCALHHFLKMDPRNAFFPDGARHAGDFAGPGAGQPRLRLTDNRSDCTKSGKELFIINGLVTLRR